MTISWRRTSSAAAVLEPVTDHHPVERLPELAPQPAAVREVAASPIAIVSTSSPSPLGPRLPRPVQGLRPPELRDAEPYEVAFLLRGMLGLPPEDPSPDEAAASLPHAMPRLVRDLDVGAWIAWCLAGLPLFAGHFPSLRELRQESKRLALALAIMRTRGNLSAAARMLRTSRKVLIENLPRMGLHAVRRQLSTLLARRDRP